MCEPTTLAIVASAAAVIGGGISAYSSYQQGAIAQGVAKNNARMAEYAAQDAKRRGDLEAANVRRQTAMLEGRQRSIMASRGLDLTVGTPADILEQTSFFGETDESMARYNAQRDAWAYRAQRQNILTEGKAAASKGRMEAFSTLLGTASDVAGMWATVKT